MFSLRIPAGYAPLYLKEFESLEEKLENIIEYLKINAVFCQVTNTSDLLTFRETNLILNVDAISICPGETSFIKSLLSEWIDVLISELNDFIHEDGDYDKIKFQLEYLKKICTEAQKENDSTNRLKFGKLNLKIQINTAWKNVPTQCLSLSSETLTELQEHLDLRKAFYGEILEHINAVSQIHEEIPLPNENPYIWDSEHAELEIAEFLLGLHIKKLKINPDYKGSIAKFNKAFYNLFGLDGKRHHQKLKQIRSRTTECALHELAYAVDDYYKKSS